MKDERELTERELDADECAPALAALVEEARSAAPPEPSDEAEAKLFARLDREDAKVVSLPRRAWMVAGLVAAAAAAVVLVGGRGAAPLEGPSAAPMAHAAGTLATTSARVTVGGAIAAPGTVLHAGDVVAVSGGSAQFDDAARVRWAVEDGAEVSVQRADDGIVLALVRGATEAQVVPVPNGEAFAVDVVGSSGDAARIAVHGTHLRVARDGDHVVVDLTEGVVSIGRPPKAGSTYGALVTAPAHVELDVKDPSALRVDHAAASVRPAVDLGPRLASASPREVAPVLEPPKVAPPPHVASAPRPTGHASAARDASEVVAEAVRTCFTQSPASPGVRVNVSTTLEIPVDADGAAHSFTFDPPLPQDVQTCAAKAIFAARFAGGPVRIPLELSR